jgi:2,4-dienoyl-CoA reductase-like NADH-dependent reductase (Old Yellow Enzyme family)
MPAYTNQQPLFTGVRMGKLELPNRIVMAPLTRMRAANSGNAPTLMDGPILQACGTLSR